MKNECKKTITLSTIESKKMLEHIFEIESEAYGCSQSNVIETHLYNSIFPSHSKLSDLVMDLFDDQITLPEAYCRFFELELSAGEKPRYQTGKEQKVVDLFLRLINTEDVEEDLVDIYLEEFISTVELLYSVLVKKVSRTRQALKTNHVDEKPDEYERLEYNNFRLEMCVAEWQYRTEILKKENRIYAKEEAEHIYEYVQNILRWWGYCHDEKETYALLVIIAKMISRKKQAYAENHAIIAFRDALKELSPLWKEIDARA